ncbi:MAG: tRNA (adenosine(37)-N6)-threonylcarbamoyltransferase complex transferase subunit TsaD, partial [Eubacteriales bacterium]|nr:tRNA (adenosine(37)-N6)-threonylcarbamoyltransferase complex transferase subunit TsaD [Eubacteriales bacterium]
MAADKAAKLRESGEALVLAIESSCDETAAAVVKNGRQVLSSAVYTQIPLHKKYGGVVPEIASRDHVKHLTPTVAQALTDAGCDFSDLSAIAVTAGPGLIGALLTGV